MARGSSAKADPAGSPALSNSDQPGGWELVGQGYQFTDAACSDAEGNFYFCDLPKGVIYRVDAVERGTPTPRVWLENGPKISGMKFGPEGRLYACVQGTGTNTVKSIAVIDPATRQVETVATGVRPNDLVVSKAGWIYFTDTEEGQVVRVPISARGMSRPAPVAGGINAPNGIGLSPDQRSILVSEYRGTNVWALSIREDGSLDGAEKVVPLRVPNGRPDSGGDGLTADAQGGCWITSHAGIQVFDATGRFAGLIPRPQEKGTVSCAFGGSGGNYLYVCSSDRIYRRKND